MKFHNCSDEYLTSLGRPCTGPNVDRTVQVSATLQITGFLATGHKSERLDGESFK